MSNEWHFVSFEFEPLLFQLDEFCSTTLLFYYDWNLCSGRKLCSSCLRSNCSTSLRLSFVSFEFEPLLFQLDEFCSTTLLFYYDWNLCSGRKLCSSCLRSNCSTSLRLSMAEKGKPEWMSMASVPIHVISWKTWPRNGTVEVKICRGVWGLELMRYCCYLVGTSYFSLSYLSPFLCPKSA